MPTQGIQDQFFDLILARFPRRADAVEALCSILNLAKDPVYRRLRGDTFLSPQEMKTLAQHFRISLDSLIYGESNDVLCTFSDFTRKVKTFTDYLEFFEGDFELIHKLPSPHLWYASAELPVFSYNLFPELMSFKLYVWGRTTWNFDWLRERPFSFDLITDPMLQLSKRILHHYLKVNSSELWTVQIMDNTLAQIEYHLYSGGFRDPKDALILMDKLREWIAHMKEVCRVGRKFAVGEKAELGQGKINVFHNEMVYTNISALITTDVGRLAYIAYCTPNFLKSTDTKLCDYAQNWFDIIIGKSTPICSGSEKERDWYFRELTQKIERRKQKIQMYIDDGNE